MQMQRARTRAKEAHPTRHRSWDVALSICPFSISVEGFCAFMPGQDLDYPGAGALTVSRYGLPQPLFSFSAKWSPSSIWC